ncbi:hypothetical protein QR98_0087810 [Sarcoptes scabiei]|uniref:Uncharacterized protein n=1 Tax=Sarcoptes scabiei TaxID=52283 RepID=A0A132AIG4_SARSC|nr:hypothetical protein QR98_0087810 [Sarcoptes scabiei]
MAEITYTTEEPFFDTEFISTKLGLVRICQFLMANEVIAIILWLIASFFIIFTSCDGEPKIAYIIAGVCALCHQLFAYYLFFSFRI